MSERRTSLLPTYNNANGKLVQLAMKHNYKNHFAGLLPTRARSFPVYKVAAIYYGSINRSSCNNEQSDSSPNVISKLSNSAFVAIRCAKSGKAITVIGLLSSHRCLSALGSFIRLHLEDASLEVIQHNNPFN